VGRPSAAVGSRQEAGKELLRHLLANIDGGARPYEIREGWTCSTATPPASRSPS